MNALVVYYSRTGRTRKAAEEIASALSADLEELRDNKKRSGPIGFIKSGIEARSGRTVNLEPLSHDPATYDIVVVGTPVWAGTMSSPVRTFLQETDLSKSRVAWFCTAGSNDQDMHKGCFNAMTEESGLTPLATIGFGTGSLKCDHAEGIANFAAVVRKSAELNPCMDRP